MPACCFGSMLEGSEGDAIVYVSWRRSCFAVVSFRDRTFVNWLMRQDKTWNVCGISAISATRKDRHSVTWAVVSWYPRLLYVSIHCFKALVFSWVYWWIVFPALCGAVLLRLGQVTHSTGSCSFLSTAMSVCETNREISKPAVALGTLRGHFWWMDCCIKYTGRILMGEIVASSTLGRHPMGGLLH